MTLAAELPPRGYISSPEERAAVSAYLSSQGSPWTGTPDYTEFSRRNSHQKVDAVYRAIHAETNADKAEVEDAYQRTHHFVEQSFNYYETKNGYALGSKVDRAFAVPVRSDRLNEDYSSESTPFVPLFDPGRFGIDSNIRMRAIYGYPPTVLDTYWGTGKDHESGALVLVPMYADMTGDIRPDRNSVEQTTRLIDTASFVLKETAEFTHRRLGADIVGLGAILPKLTNFGHSLREISGMENLVTTTGHGGTVYMIVETVRKVISETSVDPRGEIGVIGGAGSIGASSIATIRSAIPDFHIRAFDKNVELLGQQIQLLDEDGRVHLAEDAVEVLRSTNIIISAITGRINLDEADPGLHLDLSGKVIIDDSQPGCFDADQVEARGGKLVWVVGEDSSESGFITRDGLYSDGVAYNYGEKSGLHGTRSEFACGQEAAVIAKYQAFDKAIGGPVTPADAAAVGHLFADAGVRVAPFQAFGQPVTIP